MFGGPKGELLPKNSKTVNHFMASAPQSGEKLIPSPVKPLGTNFRVKERLAGQTIDQNGNVWFNGVCNEAVSETSKLKQQLEVKSRCCY